MASNTQITWRFSNFCSRNWKPNHLLFFCLSNFEISIIQVSKVQETETQYKHFIYLFTIKLLELIFFECMKRNIFSHIFIQICSPNIVPSFIVNKHSWSCFQIFQNPKLKLFSHLVLHSNYQYSCANIAPSSVYIYQTLF